MSDVLGKIGNKLHMGGHKKAEHVPDAVQSPPADHTEVPSPQEPTAEQGQVQPVRPEAVTESVKTEPAHGGALDKIKEKLHVGKDKLMGKKNGDAAPPPHHH